MKRYNACLLALLLAGGIGIPAAAAELVFLVNAKNETDSLTRRQVQDIYWGKTGRWQGKGLRIRLFMRERYSKANKLLYDKVLKTISSRFNRFWIGQMLSGRGRTPDRIKNIAELIEEIAATEGGIGFITRKEKDALGELKGIKVLKIR